MKKIYSFLLMLLMAVVSVNTAQATEEIIYDGGSWSIQRGSSFLSSNTAICLNIKDASVCQDYTSTSATPWASYKDEIEEVFFRFEGDNFKVGTYMFAEMPKLQGVWRWSGTCKIKANAFQNCSKLEVCQLTGDATSVGDYAFQNCSSLKVAQFSHITSIGKYAFAGCSSLEKMECFSGVNSYTIGERAFDRCSAMYQADVEKATSIGDYAFINCYALKSIELTKCKTISQNAFRGCDLETITIGSAIESIGDYAFHSAINDRAHIYMNSSFPPTTGTDAFYSVDCSTISLHVPEGYEYAYSSTYPWSQFRINPDPYTIYGVYNGTKFTIYYDDQMDARGGIEEWWWETNRKDVTSAVLDASVDDARPTSTKRWFYEMEKLTSITNLNYLHTEKVTDMYGMFTGCKKLTSIDLANFRTSNVTNFSDMFSWCESLTEIDVNPLDLSSATNTYFMFGLCTNLEKIYCDKDWSQYSSNMSLSHDVFDRCTNLLGGRGTVYTSTSAGKGLSYARPDGGPDAPGYFWRSTDDGLNHQDIDNVQSDKVQSTKVIRDGQLLIERNGKTFNAQGVEVK